MTALLNCQVFADVYPAISFVLNARKLSKLYQQLNRPPGLYERKRKMDRPDFVCDEHLEYLDKLRESGVTNMFDAKACVQREFDILNKKLAEDILVYWMQTFGKDDR